PVSTASPAEVIAAGEFVLLRQRVDDAAAIAEAVATSLAELRPWMPWATKDATDPAVQQRRLERLAAGWDAGSAFDYVIVEGEKVIGVANLFARVGDGALELGYWVRSDYTGRGIASACAACIDVSGSRASRH